MSADILKKIDLEDMKNIALGGAFLGTGGGGDPYIGRLMAEQAIRANGPVDVVDVDSLADDALVIPVAMMGAPTVMLEKLPRGDEANNALKSLEDYLGKKADAIFCIEAGGLNSTIPIAVAAGVGLPIVDGDGMGRAFPELQMVSMTMHDITACPMVMADEKGNSLVLNTVDNLSTEKFARVITIEMGGAGLIALYPMTGAQAKKAILRGSMSLINSIGRIIHEEQAANRNPVHKLSKDLNGVSLFEGRVMDVDRRTEGGFARGSCTIEGLGSYDGESISLEFQNEFLLAKTADGKPKAITPDLICLLDLETGQPITTEQIRYGFRVIVFGLPCDPQWRTDHGIELAGPRYFGYDLDYQKLEALN
ncbi:DUF917 domain-containing protein [Maritalea myrionectae]|uniref:DUF917 domain-containing protein n=1 Tax=Maritalea myrionectae TaxID=454601 RepID=UPI0003FCE389|nr:DUF917 domain-containing protein [Maritalea myrionectae]